MLVFLKYSVSSVAYLFVGFVVLLLAGAYLNSAVVAQCCVYQVVCLENELKLNGSYTHVVKAFWFVSFRVVNAHVTLVVRVSIVASWWRVSTFLVANFGLQWHLEWYPVLHMSVAAPSVYQQLSMVQYVTVMRAVTLDSRHSRLEDTPRL
jgi:hypothetical protein